MSMNIPERPDQADLQLEQTPLTWEVRSDGLLVVVHGSQEALWGVFQRVWPILDGTPLPQHLANRYSVDFFEPAQQMTLRPGGAYALQMQSGDLWVDCRNLRGDQKLIDEFKEKVVNVLQGL